MKLKKLLTLLILLSNFSFGAVTFTDDFESPDVITSYTVANTSGTANSKWVRSTTGFGATRNGIIDSSYEGTWTAPSGNQAYGFRYTNSGVTTSFGSIGSLQAGATITVSFDVFRDGATSGSNYRVGLVTFNGSSTRNDTDGGGLVQNTSSFLKEITGIAPISGYSTISFSYIVGNAVKDSNGAKAGVSTLFDNAVLGHDIGLRFQGSGSSASFDNVSIDVLNIPEPSFSLIFSIFALFLLTNRRR